MTRTNFKQSDSGIITLTSRARRKRHSHLNAGRGSTWWAPSAIGWWIGILFAVGATCFALGAVPGYLSAVGGEADGITFFVGSLWFTSAAFLQYLEAVNVDRDPSGVDFRQRFRLLAFEPRRIDWWATLVQLLGTLFFNATTFHALSVDLSVRQLNRLVWAPTRSVLCAFSWRAGSRGLRCVTPSPAGGCAACPGGSRPSTWSVLSPSASRPLHRS